MTGRFFPSAAGVQMFRTRQSSSGAGSFPRAALPGCGDGGPSFRVSRTPVQGFRGGAALKRFAAETGPAYGIPRNMVSPVADSPRTRPAVVFTSTNSGFSDCAKAPDCERAAMDSQVRRVRVGEERSAVIFLEDYDGIGVGEPCCGTCYGSCCGLVAWAEGDIIERKGFTVPARERGVADSAAVLGQLARILSTPLFQHSKRYPALLR